MAPTEKKSDRSLALAREAYLDCDYRKALTLLDQALKDEERDRKDEEPDREDDEAVRHRRVLYCERARVRLAMLYYAGALDDADKALLIKPSVGKEEKDNPSMFLALIFKGKALWELNQLAAAFDVFFEAKKIDSAKYNCVWSAEEECSMLWRAGREEFLGFCFERSIMFYSKALNKQPKHGIYIDRARAYLEINNYTGALDDLNKAFEAEKVPPHCYVLKGFILMGLGQLHLAKDAFASYLERWDTVDLGVLPNVDLGHVSTYVPPMVVKSVIENLQSLIDQLKFNESRRHEGFSAYFKQMSTEVHTSDFLEIDFTEIVKLYSDALAMQKMNRGLYKDTVEAHILVAEFLEALHLAVDNMNLDPEASNCQLVKGDFWMKLNENEKAMQSFDQGLQALQQISDRAAVLSQKLNGLKAKCQGRLPGNN